MKKSKNNRNYKKILNKFLVILVITLFVNLPLVTALQISDVQPTEINTNSAKITWQTDIESDGFVNYGTNKEDLQTIGSSVLTTQHDLELKELQPNTTYYFNVQSQNVTDTNSDEFYTLSTLAPDTTKPILTVDLPDTIAGTRLEVRGTTKPLATIQIFLNELFILERQVNTKGEFEILDIILNENSQNTIRIEAIDLLENKADPITKTILTDTIKPKFTLNKFPEYVEDNVYDLVATINEPANFEIIVNNNSQVTLEQVTDIDESINLQEGNNNIQLIATDKAGWQTTFESTIIMDTRPPQINFELEKGTQYYEGRAETDITGTTDPKANVYLYVFRNFGDEYKANFKRAQEKVTADEEGNFKFSEINFPPPVFNALSELAPRQVPNDLQDILISPLSKLGTEQRKSYNVYILAEDVSGKTAYSQKTVNVNSCFSADGAFDITPIVQYQAPFRLDPALMSEGRESIQAVFNISYRGAGFSSNIAGDQNNKPFDIKTIRVQKACTADLADSDDYSLGCQLLPKTINEQRNQDNSVMLIRANLARADEFVDKDDDIWEDFNKRRLKMPIKLVVNYQERGDSGAFGPTKTQNVCVDLGYFVDIPIDSEDLIPDFIADEGVQSMNWTINQIEDVKPYLETAMLVTGVSCIGSFLVKMISRFYRNFMSNFEPWLTRLKGKDEACPQGLAQDKLFLDGTIEHFEELKNHPDLQNQLQSQIPTLDAKADSLNERCPKTASAWEIETIVDKAYRFTCDRFLCRSVPASWTSEKDVKDIQTVIDSQSSCSATSTCSPLDKIENCQDRITRSSTSQNYERVNGTFECYYNRDNNLYYTIKGDPDLEENNIWTLTPEEKLQDVGTLSAPDLLAYKPQNSDQICVAAQRSCDSMCKRVGGYVPVDDGFETFSTAGIKVGKTKSSTRKGCYKEVNVDGEITLRGSNNEPITQGKVKAGYTTDCFIDQEEQQLYQCVCEPDKKLKATAPIKAREALKKVGTNEETWVFRQDRVFANSKGTAGTLYPKERYYSGRDFSGAFGASYGLDNFRDEDYKVARVDPHKQIIGTFQSACLPGIYARLTTLQSILRGMRDCIEQAKYTGFYDAGACKTIFTQYACGLIYKAISYAANDCSPLNINDAGEEGSLDFLSKAVESGSRAIPATIDSSISEIKDDYGNAQLDQFFSSGAQGFAESICLAAFGYDWPMGADFIMDTAYAFPTASNVFFPVAERELSTFDPQKGTAVFNYNVAGTVIPGCKIRSYRTYLKCVGPEDTKYKGFDCGGQQCDCMQATGEQSQFENQRTYPLQGGSGLSGLTKGQFTELKIESPQKVSSAFRYDHVVLELNLDSNEDPNTCFDEGFVEGNTAKYYFPIRDTSAPGIISCQVHPSSGRYQCPEVSSLFRGSNTYFESPFIKCYDKRSDEYVSCDKPNLFLKDESIVVKTYINMGKDKACLLIEDDQGKITKQNVPLPEGLVGPTSPVITIGTVTESLFSGGVVNTIIKTDESDNGCGAHANGDLEVISRGSTKSGLNAKKLVFTYEKIGTNYVLHIPDDVTLLSTGGFSSNNKRVSQNNVVELTTTQLNNAIFKIGGFEFKKVLGTPELKDPSKNTGQCVYQIVDSKGTSFAKSYSSLRLKARLLKPAGDRCFDSNEQLPSTALGKTNIVEEIRIQLEPQEATISKGIYEDFNQNRWAEVRVKAQQVINRGEGSIEDARAIYYLVASFASQTEGISKFRNSIIENLDLFFKRQNVKRESSAYAPETQELEEYQKINTYLCCTAKKAGNTYDQCSTVTCE
jgi:hypothetical protein